VAAQNATKCDKRQQKSLQEIKKGRRGVSAGCRQEELKRNAMEEEESWDHLLTQLVSTNNSLVPFFLFV